MRHVLLTSAALTAMMWATMPANAQTATDDQSQSTTPTTNSNQSRDAQADQGVPEIVVTANKRRERLSDVPAAISVLTGASLEQSGAAQFSQYFDKVPGLSAAPTGQPGKAIVSIRGITTGSAQTNATVGTYINDVPFGSSGGLAIGGTFIADPNTFDVERIEVLKGPQGTLYGASTLGGLIKTVYATPALGEYQARVMLDGSTVEHGGLGYMANGMVNAPVGDDFAIRAVISSRRDPGFIDSVNPQNVRGDQNSAGAFGARVIALYRPTQVFAAELTAIYQNTRSHGLDQVDVDPVTLRPTVGDLRTAENFVQPSDQLRYQIYSGKLTYDFGPASLTSVSSYGHYSEDQRLDTTNSIGLGVVVPDDTHITLGNFTQEVRLASPTGARFEWLLGGFYSDQSNTWNFRLHGLDPATLQPLATANPLENLYTFGARTSYRELAGFANATYKLTNKFSVTGGLRYSGNRQSYTYGRSGLFVGPSSTTTGRSKDEVLTYSASLQYKPNTHTLFYIKTANGYRPGGPQVSNLTGLNLPATFDPDKTKNYEVGAKLATADRKLSLDISGFSIDWSRIQLLSTVVIQVNGTPQRRSLIANAGNASSRGFDFNLRYRPVPGVSLGFGGGYTDAHLRDAARSLGASAGERIPYTPRWTFSGSVDYEMPLAGTAELNFGASGRYVSSRFNYFSADPTGNIRASLPAYFLLDLRAGVKFDDEFEIDLRVNNVTDKRAIYSAFSNAYNSAPPFNLLNDSAVVAQPRTYGVSITKRF